MKKILIVRMSVLVIALMFVLSTAPSTGAVFSTIKYPPVPVFVADDDKCANTTDDQIVDAIYAKMMKKYKGESKHVNVRSTDRVVTVEGWASSEKIKKGIIKIVQKTKCVKSVNSDTLTVGKSGGCGPGEKDCGGSCIPSTAKCNTRG